MAIDMRKLWLALIILVASCSSDAGLGADSATDDSTASTPGEFNPVDTDESDVGEVDGSEESSEGPVIEEFIPFELEVGPTDLEQPALVGWLTGYEPALADYPTVGREYPVIHVGSTRIELEPEIRVAGSCALSSALERRSGSSGAAAKGCVVFANLDAGEPWIFLLSAGDLIPWSAQGEWEAAFESPGEVSVIITGFDPERSLLELEQEVALVSSVDPTRCGDEAPVGLLDLSTATISEVACGS